MKRYGILVATAALCAALGTTGPALAFDGDGQQCCGWHYGGDYSYGCGCYYGYVPGLAGVAVGRLAVAASFPFAPLAASVWAAPPMTGNFCVAAGVTCVLPEPLWFGKDCFCGYARGVVQ